MVDSRFYTNKGPFTLAHLSEVGQCEIYRGSPSLEIQEVAPLDDAGQGSISLFNNAKYMEALHDTGASACIMDAESAEKAPESLPILVSKNPHRSFALIAAAFYPHVKPVPSIHPTAIIDASASLGQGCEIGPYVVIGKNVILGDNVIVRSHVTIGDNCSLGEGCVIESHASIEFAMIGRHVHIKSGARIGQSGFGFAIDERGYVPVPQLGRVIIEDFAQVGANTTVDRGSGHDTMVGQGSRIDNLVQLGHNVQLGKGCVIVSQTGISGSTKLGNYVMCGGQVGIAGHLNIGDGAQLAAKCGIQRDVSPKEILMGYPGMPIKEFYRQVATVKKLAKEGRAVTTKR